MSLNFKGLNIIRASKISYLKTKKYILPRNINGLLEIDFNITTTENLLQSNAKTQDFLLQRGKKTDHQNKRPVHLLLIMLLNDCF